MSIKIYSFNDIDRLIAWIYIVSKDAVSHEAFNVKQGKY